jgi:hypothetical protein
LAFTFSSTPTTPIRSRWLGTSRNFTSPSTEGSQDFCLFALKYPEVIKGTAEFGMDFVEQVECDLQVEMRVAELSDCVLKWPRLPGRRPIGFSAT